MSIKVQLKHSAVKDKAPVAADLTNGELALNINDQSPAAYIKDSAGNIVKIAGAGAVGDDWTRTGTELSPATAGDSVFTTGAVKVGGTTAAPKTQLNADGSATFADDVKIGGTLPASPNISLNANGTATFKGAVTATNGTGSTAIYPNGSVVLDYAYALTGAKVFVVQAGSPSSEVCSIKDDGSATFAGNLNILGAVSRVYADNTAAKTAGLVDGDVYRKADGTLMIVFT